MDARLQGLLDAKVDSAKVYGSEVVDVVSSLRDLCLRGGKRLRAALIVAGFRATTAEGDLEPAIDAGVALELLQSYFLVHDDWMDGDEVRRGGPAVHAWLSKRLGSRSLGERAAILAGDHAAGLALEMMTKLEIAPERHQPVMAAFAQMQIDAVIGQQLDIIAQNSDPEATYVLKTGSYTVRGPLRIGALLAGAKPRILTTLDRFALPVGVAFQLRDDLLGAFGEPEQTGKPLGSDLKTAKRTVLLLNAMRLAKPKDRALLKAVVGNARASEKTVRLALEALERTGARAVVEARIEALVAEARLSLKAGRLSPAGRALLEGAADVLTARRI